MFRELPAVYTEVTIAELMLTRSGGDERKGRRESRGDEGHGQPSFDAGRDSAALLSDYMVVALRRVTAPSQSSGGLGPSQLVAVSNPIPIPAPLLSDAVASDGADTHRRSFEQQTQTATIRLSVPLVHVEPRNILSSDATAAAAASPSSPQTPRCFTSSTAVEVVAYRLPHPSSVAAGWAQRNAEQQAQTAQRRDEAEVTDRSKAFMATGLGGGGGVVVPLLTGGGVGDASAGRGPTFPSSSSPPSSHPLLTLTGSNIPNTTPEALALLHLIESEGRYAHPLPSSSSSYNATPLLPVLGRRQIVSFDNIEMTRYKKNKKNGSRVVELIPPAHNDDDGNTCHIIVGAKVSFAFHSNRLTLGEVMGLSVNDKDNASTSQDNRLSNQNANHKKSKVTAAAAARKQSSSRLTIVSASIEAQGDGADLITAMAARAQIQQHRQFLERQKYKHATKTNEATTASLSPPPSHIAGLYYSTSGDASSIPAPQPRSTPPLSTAHFEQHLPKVLMCDGSGQWSSTTFSCPNAILIANAAASATGGNIGGGAGGAACANPLSAAASIAEALLDPFAKDELKAASAINSLLQITPAVDLLKGLDSGGGGSSRRGGGEESDLALSTVSHKVSTPFIPIVTGTAATASAASSAAATSRGPSSQTSSRNATTDNNSPLDRVVQNARKARFQSKRFSLAVMEPVAPQNIEIPAQHLDPREEERDGALVLVAGDVVGDNGVPLHNNGSVESGGTRKQHAYSSSLNSSSSPPSRLSSSSPPLMDIPRMPIAVTKFTARDIHRWVSRVDSLAEQHGGGGLMGRMFGVGDGGSMAEDTGRVNFFDHRVGGIVHIEETTCDVEGPTKGLTVLKISVEMSRTTNAEEITTRLQQCENEELAEMEALASANEETTRYLELMRQHQQYVAATTASFYNATASAISPPPLPPPAPPTPSLHTIACRRAVRNAATLHNSTAYKAVLIVHRMPHWLAAMNGEEAALEIDGDDDDKRDADDEGSNNKLRGMGWGLALQGARGRARHQKRQRIAHAARGSEPFATRGEKLVAKWFLRVQRWREACRGTLRLTGVTVGGGGGENVGGFDATFGDVAVDDDDGGHTDSSPLLFLLQPIEKSANVLKAHTEALMQSAIALSTAEATAAVKQSCGHTAPFNQQTDQRSFPPGTEAFIAGRGRFDDTLLSRGNDHGYHHGGAFLSSPPPSHRDVNSYAEADLVRSPRGHYNNNSHTTATRAGVSFQMPAPTAASSSFNEGGNASALGRSSGGRFIPLSPAVIAAQRIDASSAAFAPNPNTAAFTASPPPFSSSPSSMHDSWPNAFSPTMHHRTGYPLNGYVNHKAPQPHEQHLSPFSHGNYLQHSSTAPTHATSYIDRSRLGGEQQGQQGAFANGQQQQSIGASRQQFNAYENTDRPHFASNLDASSGTMAASPLYPPSSAQFSLDDREAQLRRGGLGPLSSVTHRDHQVRQAMDEIKAINATAAVMNMDLHPSPSGLMQTGSTTSISQPNQPPILIANPTSSSISIMQRTLESMEQRMSENFVEGGRPNDYLNLRARPAVSSEKASIHANMDAYIDGYSSPPPPSSSQNDPYQQRPQRREPTQLPAVAAESSRFNVGDNINGSLATMPISQQQQSRYFAQQPSLLVNYNGGHHHHNHHVAAADSSLRSAIATGVTSFDEEAKKRTLLDGCGLGNATAAAAANANATAYLTNNNNNNGNASFASSNFGGGAPPPMMSNVVAADGSSVMMVHTRSHLPLSPAAVPMPTMTTSPQLIDQSYTASGYPPQPQRLLGPLATMNALNPNSTITPAGANHPLLLLPPVEGQTNPFVRSTKRDHLFRTLLNAEETPNPLLQGIMGDADDDDDENTANRSKLHTIRPLFDSMSLTPSDVLFMAALHYPTALADVAPLYYTAIFAGVMGASSGGENEEGGKSCEIDNIASKVVGGGANPHLNVSSATGMHRGPFTTTTNVNGLSAAPSLLTSNTSRRSSTVTKANSARSDALIAAVDAAASSQNAAINRDGSKDRKSELYALYRSLFLLGPANRQHKSVFAEPSASQANRHGKPAARRINLFTHLFACPEVEALLDALLNDPTAANAGSSGDCSRYQWSQEDVHGRWAILALFYAVLYAPSIFVTAAVTGASVLAIFNGLKLFLFGPKPLRYEAIGNGAKGNPAKNNTNNTRRRKKRLGLFDGLASVFSFSKASPRINDTVSMMKHSNDSDQGKGSFGFVAAIRAESLAAAAPKPLLPLIRALSQFATTFSPSKENNNGDADEDDDDDDDIDVLLDGTGFPTTAGNKKMRRLTALPLQHMLLGAMANRDPHFYRRYVALLTAQTASTAAQFNIYPNIGGGGGYFGGYSRGALAHSPNNYTAFDETQQQSPSFFSNGVPRGGNVGAATVLYDPFNPAFPPPPPFPSVSSSYLTPMLDPVDHYPRRQYVHNSTLLTQQQQKVMNPPPLMAMVPAANGSGGGAALVAADRLVNTSQHHPLLHVPTAPPQLSSPARTANYTYGGSIGGAPSAMNMSLFDLSRACHSYRLHRDLGLLLGTSSARKTPTTAKDIKGAKGKGISPSLLSSPSSSSSSSSAQPLRHQTKVSLDVLAKLLTTALIKGQQHDQRLAGRGILSSDAVGQGSGIHKGMFVGSSSSSYSSHSQSAAAATSIGLRLRRFLLEGKCLPLWLMLLASLVVFNLVIYWCFYASPPSSLSWLSLSAYVGRDSTSFLITAALVTMVMAPKSPIMVWARLCLRLFLVAEELN